MEVTPHYQQGFPQEKKVERGGGVVYIEYYHNNRH